jgi:exoribonuclease-2
MERYWCLRWLLQENVGSVQATVMRENLCRFDELPLVARVASLPSLRSGTRVVLDISEIDLFELTFHCEFKRELDGAMRAVAVEPVVAVEAVEEAASSASAAP